MIASCSLSASTSQPTFITMRYFKLQHVRDMLIVDSKCGHVPDHLASATNSETAIQMAPENEPTMEAVCSLGRSPVEDAKMRRQFLRKASIQLFHYFELFHKTGEVYACAEINRSKRLSMSTSSFTVIQ